MGVDQEDPKCGKCGRAATYGAPVPGVPPTRCAAHRSDEMVRKMPGVCSEPCCTLTASYGTLLAGRTKCAAHRTDDMVNLDKYGLCTVRSCTQKAVYGIMYPPQRCAAHKEPGMLDLVHGWCSQPGCTLRRQERSRWCPAHQLL